MIPRLGGRTSPRVSRSGKSMTGTRRLSATIFLAAFAGLLLGSPAFGRAVGGGQPDPPRSLHVTSVSASTLAVAWKAPQARLGFTRYEVRLNGVLETTTPWTSLQFTKLSCGRSYKVAVDTVSYTGRSAPVSVTTSTSPCAAPPPPTTTTQTPPPPPTTTTASPPPPDTTPPSTPTNLAATNATGQSVSVSWSPANDNVGVAGYAVSVNGSSAGTTQATSYTATGLSCGTTAQIGVVAYDAAGNKSGQATTNVATSACPDTTPPTTPWPIVIQSSTATSIAVSWPAAIDNVGVVGYQLFLGSTKVASGNFPLSYTYTGLTCGTSYQLSVLAYDAAGNVSLSQGSASATTAACPAPPPVGDTTPPSPPGNVLATSPTTQGVTLTWTASTDNVGVTGYSVYVGTALAGTTSSTSYPLTGLTCGTTYSFGVEAKDAAGNVSQRTTATGATAACAVPPPPNPGPAQVAVATNGNDATCVRGDLTKPCKTFQQAYQIAQLGDTVQVAAGSYPSQTINDVAGKTAPSSSVVTFAAVGTVSLAGLQIGDQFTNPDAADNITFEGITGNSAWGIQPDAHNITFDHVATTNIQAHGVTGFTVTNSAFGNCTVVDVNGPCDNFKIDGGTTNVTISNDTFLNFRVAPGSSEHFECFFMGDSGNVSITNSTFDNCTYYDIFAQADAGNDNVLISGNTFNPAYDPTTKDSESAVNISNRGGTWNNWNVSGNTFTPGSTFKADAGGSYTNFKFSNDTFGVSGNCVAGATYVNNTWPSGSC